MPKIYEYPADESNPRRVVRQYWFQCPGCKNTHAFTVFVEDPGRGWTFNDDFERPTFMPSLLCNKDYPESRCHSFVTDGRIQFLGDCWHDLKNQTVDIPDWEND